MKKAEILEMSKEELMSLNIVVISSAPHDVYKEECKDCKNCYNCFECYNCKNCKECHNCEYCDYCLFCYGVSNLKYAIFNVEFSKEEYFKKLKELGF